MGYESEEEMFAMEGAAEQSQPEPPITQFSYVPVEKLTNLRPTASLKEDVLKHKTTITQEGLAKVLFNSFRCYIPIDSRPWEQMTLEAKDFYLRQAAAIIEYLKGGEK